MVRHGSAQCVGVQWVEVKLHQDLFMIWPSAQTAWTFHKSSTTERSTQFYSNILSLSVFVRLLFVSLWLYICSTLSLPIARSPVRSIPFDTQFNNFRNMFYDWKHIGYIFFPRSAVSFVGSFITETAHTTVQLLETLTILNVSVY